MVKIKIEAVQWCDQDFEVIFVGAGVSTIYMAVEKSGLGTIPVYLV